MSSARTHLPLAAGWYGKLPSRGDFVGHGLPAEWLTTWDRWLDRALAAAAASPGSPGLRRQLLAMAPWQCLVLPVPPDASVWCGVVAPSVDRVGRAFPLLLAEAYDEASIDGVGLAALRGRALVLADWLDRIGTLATPEAFESGLAQWLATPWPDEGGCETLSELRRSHPDARSFWWRAEPLDGLRPALVEGWPPRESLLGDWLHG